MRLICFWLICLPVFSNCNFSSKNSIEEKPFIIVLGIAQDAGFPQAACAKECCKIAWKHKHHRKKTACLGIVDPILNKAWIFDATPDFKDQLYMLENIQGEDYTELAGIFLTHAHMGHYTGLMHLGREAVGSKEVPVFAMPRMKSFLETNGPWSQLVSLNNIGIRPLQADSAVVLPNQIKVTPFFVPHRDEFSETVGYKIEGPGKSVLFIPDIDKWHLWERGIVEEIQKVDYAFLDGTFFQNGEIPGRDMSEIPHPFVEESMELFKDLPAEEKAKVHFIHFNHTNPVLEEGGEERQRILDQGFSVSKEKLIIEL